MFSLIYFNFSELCFFKKSLKHIGLVGFEGIKLLTVFLISL